MPEPAASATLSNVSHLGAATGTVAGATLTLLDGTNAVATTTSDASGNFSFEDVDTQALYNLRIEKDGAVRVYQSVRVSELSGMELRLPLALREFLITQLTALEATQPLVLAYQTAGIRAQLEAWNGPEPDFASEFVFRDESLARLVTATEALVQLFNGNHAIATDAGEFTVDAILGIVAMRSALSDVSAQIGAGGLSMAEKFLIKSIEIALAGLQEITSEMVKKSLPPWAAELYDRGTKILIKGAIAAMEEPGAMRQEGFKAALEALAEALAKDVTGLALSSSYVFKTQEDLSLAEVRTGQFLGIGTPLEGFQMAQARLIQHTEYVDDVLNLNELVGDTAEGWGEVADMGLVVGQVPAAQIVAVASGIIKRINTVAITAVTVRNYWALYGMAFERTPDTLGASFGYPLNRPAAAWPKAGRTLLMAGADGEYSAALTALRAALSDPIDGNTVLPLAEATLTASDAYDVALAAQRNRIAAHGGGDTPDLVLALGELAVAESELAAERMLLYARLAGLLEPDLADPAWTLAQADAQFDAVNAAMLAVEDALSAAATLTGGMTSGAVLMVGTHGLQGANNFMLGPGPFALRVDVTNAGDAVAQEVRVVLALDVDGPASRLTVHDPLTQTLPGSLAPGETITLLWHGTYAASVGEGTPLQVHYEVAPEAGDGRGFSVQGGFVLSPRGGADYVFGDGFDASME